MKPRIGLGGKCDASEITFSVRLSLKKDEKMLLWRAADARRMETANGKPAIAAVVASLVRQGLRCIQEHSEDAPEAPLDEIDAFQAGLSLRGPPK